MAIAQDLIYHESNGRNPTPKSMALAMAVRQITGSERLIRILNGFGHCVSHSSVLRHDTALAEQSINSSKELPNNVLPGKFATVVVDNADFGEEAKYQTHITNMIIVQNPSEYPVIEKTFTKKTRRKALNAPNEIIDEYAIMKKKSPSFHQYQLDISNSKTDEINQAKLKDLLYILLKGFAEGDLLPDWTGYITH